MSKMTARPRFAALQQDIMAMVGEFIGTTMFLFLGLGGAKSALASVPDGLRGAQTGLDSETIMIISVSMGLSLLVTAWIFFRITGGLFNPAVTLGLYLVGAIRPFRALLLLVGQLAGGIAGSGLLAVLIPKGGIAEVVTTLQPGINKGQGLMIEAFLTAMLVFCVLMLAAEKHRATYLAPLGIGLTLFACQLMGTLWTGCAMNPARALGPSVIARYFPGYHWIYWAGPFIGSFIAAGFYILLKAFDYTSVVTSQDSDDANNSPTAQKWQSAVHGFSRAQREALLASGMDQEMLDAAEKGMVVQAEVALAMSRTPTTMITDNGPVAGIMSRSQTNRTVTITLPVSAGVRSSGSWMGEKSAVTQIDGMIASSAMEKKGTATTIPLGASLGEPDFGDAHLLPKSASGNVHVGMAPAQQDTGAIGEPGLEGHGLAAVDLVADMLRN